MKRQRISNSLIHLCLFAATLFFMSCILSPFVFADPINNRSYLSQINSRAVALDTDHNLLYVGVESGSNNLRTLLLDAHGDTTTTWSLHSIGGETIALSLDAQRDRLYSANNVTGPSSELTIITLNNGTGTIVSGVNYNPSNYAAQCLALDSQRNRLYVGLADSNTGLMVVTLDAAGDYSSSVLITTNREVHALAIDAARNKLYCGYTNGDVGTCDLNTSGDVLSVNVPLNIGSGDVSSMALNTFDNTLYVAEESDNNLYTFNLQNNGGGDPGELIAMPNTFFLGTSIYCLTLDATRGRMYMGTHSGSSDLRWLNLDSSAIPTGGATSFAGSNVEAIALDAKRQRLYGVMSFSSQYYELTDVSMPTLLIDHGAATTNSVTVELHWSLPNAHYVRVASSSDLVSYNFPDVASPNTTFDQWYSTGFERWSNNGSARANTLTVNAVLTGGSGDKTIRIWFSEDAGAGNGASVSHYETAVINLTSGGTPTYTATISPTPSSTFTVTPTSTFTSTDTPTATPSTTRTSSPTPSHTQTITVSPTGSPTDTVTYTHTPSITPTITPTTTITPTWTMTSTVSPTPSNTPLATPTVTPTVTPTGTPTGTGTITPTETMTITVSPTASHTETYSPTPMVTATPTASRTMTATITGTNTPSPTVSPSPSVTTTVTISPTITTTATITMTVPPTLTPTPAAVLYLDKNKFIPGSEVLRLKVGALKDGTKQVTIFTLLGKQVWQETIVVAMAGYHYVEWDGRNQQGESVAAGVYFIVLDDGGERIIKKVLVIR